MIRSTASVFLVAHDLEEVYVGMPVQVTFETIRDGWVLPQFRPV